MAENRDNQGKTPPEIPKQSAIDKLLAFVQKMRGITRLTIHKMKNIEKSNMELGIRQLRAGNYFDAGLRFKFVVWYNKNNVIAHYLLGKSYYYRGKLAEAVPHFKEALRLDPSLEEAQFLLTCCGAKTNITAVPRSFIIEKLDRMALNYESFVTSTASKVNNLAEEGLQKVIGETMGFNVLDLGARGGDTAQLLRSKANQIIGVEPSLKLGAIAKTRRVNGLLAYNQLSGRFPQDYLRETKEKFDIILSMFYLDNLGALEEYFKLVANVCKPKSLFAFNIHRNDGSEDYTFKTSSLMFLHSLNYVLKLIQANGFTIVMQREVMYNNTSPDVIFVVVKD